MAPVDVRFQEPYLRPMPELVEAWPQILAAVDALDVPGQTPFEALSPHTRYLLGVHAAAAWCLGATSRAPMARADRPVLFPDLADEQAMAVRVSHGEHGGWEDYARGVVRWMWFLTGVIDVLVLTD